MLLLNHPPAGTRAEEAAEVAAVGVGGGGKRDVARGYVTVEATQRQQQRPARHAASVMVSALHFVPRVAPYAVMALPRRPHDLQPFFQPTFIYEVGGHLVFDSSPTLV